MKLYMQVLIALGLGLKRNWHIFAGLILGVFAVFSIAQPTLNAAMKRSKRIRARDKLSQQEEE